MFIPLYDYNPLRRIPWPFVTRGLIVVTSLVYVVFQSGLVIVGDQVAAAGFAVVPVRLDAGAVRAALAAVFVPTDLGVLLSSTPHRGPPRLRPVF